MTAPTVVTAGVSALLGIFTVFPFLWTAACVAVVVLPFTGRAAEWYAERPAGPHRAPGAITEL